MKMKILAIYTIIAICVLFQSTSRADTLTPIPLVNNYDAYALQNMRNDATFSNVVNAYSEEISEKQNAIRETIKQATYELKVGNLNSFIVTMNKLKIDLKNVNSKYNFSLSDEFKAYNLLLDNAAKLIAHTRSSCSPPYAYDQNGIKRFKSECF